jgi:membrane-bound lytic murein transglycosylase D
MKRILHIFILLPIVGFGQLGVDSVPVKDSSTSRTISKTSLVFNSDKGTRNKYSFVPITSTIKLPKTKYASNTVIQGFYNQAIPFQYNLTLEAQDFLNTYKRRNEAELIRLKSTGAYYLSAMQSILVQNGIPRQLVYLAVIETHLDVNLVSWAGATGMWQFMPETGRQYGLQVSGGIDERYDWYKSTYAAARFLRDLYNQFNDWLLVAAAYNGGPGRVSSAIRQSGSRNFWQLQNYLPSESSTYVKKFIGTQMIMEGTSSIAGVAPFIDEKAKKFFNPLEKGAVAVDTTNNKMLTEIISGRYNSLILSKYILLDIASFNILNPNFDNELAINASSYNLRLPQDKMQLFQVNKLQIMNESLQLFLTINNAVVNDTPTVKPIKRKKN